MSAWREVPAGISPGWWECEREHAGIVLVVVDVWELVPERDTARWGWAVYASTTGATLADGFEHTLQRAKARAAMA